MVERLRVKAVPVLGRAIKVADCSGALFPHVVARHPEIEFVPWEQNEDAFRISPSFVIASTELSALDAELVQRNETVEEVSLLAEMISTEDGAPIQYGRILDIEELAARAGAEIMAVAR